MHHNFKLLPWQMMGCAALLLGNSSTVQAQDLPPQSILLAQSAQITDVDHLFNEELEPYQQQTAESYDIPSVIIKENLYYLVNSWTETRLSQDREKFSKCRFDQEVFDTYLLDEETTSYLLLRTENYLDKYKEIDKLTSVTQYEDICELEAWIRELEGFNSPPPVVGAHLNIPISNKLFFLYDLLFGYYSSTEDLINQSRILANKANLYSKMDQYSDYNKEMTSYQERVTTNYEEAIRIIESMNQPRQMLSTLFSYKHYLFWKRDFEKAYIYMQKILDLLQNDSFQEEFEYEEIRYLNAFLEELLSVEENQKAISLLIESLEFQKLNGDEVRQTKIIELIPDLVNSRKGYASYIDQNLNLALEMYESIAELYSDATSKDFLDIIISEIPRIYFQLGQFSKGLEFHNHLIEIAPSTQDMQTLKARAFFDLGNVYMNLKQYTLGIEYHHEALEIATRLNDQEAQSFLLSLMSYNYMLANNKELSELYEAEFKTLKNELPQANCSDQPIDIFSTKFLCGGLLNISLDSGLKSIFLQNDYLFKDKIKERNWGNKYDDGMLYFSEEGEYLCWVANLLSKVSDDYQNIQYNVEEKCKTFNIDISAYEQFSRKNTVLVSSNESAKLATEDFYYLDEIGDQYLRKNDSVQAINAYGLALDSCIKLDDLSCKLESSINFGDYYLKIEKLKLSLNHYNTALDIANRERENESFDDEAKKRIFRSIAGVYIALENEPYAASFYRESMKSLLEQSDGRGIINDYELIGLQEHAQYHINIIQFYDEFKQQSLIPYTNSLCPINDPLFGYIGADQLGDMYFSAKQYDNAFKYHLKCLSDLEDFWKLYSLLKANGGYGVLLEQLIYQYFVQEEYSYSAQLHRKYIEVALLNRDPFYEIEETDSIAEDYIKKNELDVALELYYRALKTSLNLQKNPDYSQFDLVGRSYANIASLLSLKQEKELAIIFYKKAIQSYENVRITYQSNGIVSEKDFSKLFFTEHEDDYRHLADLLLQQNRVFEAQRVLDLLKVQELDDLFDNAQVRSSNNELGIFHRSPESDFLERYNAKLREEIALGKEYTALQTRNNNAGLSPTEEDRFLELEARQTDNKNTLTAFLNDPSIQAILEQLKDYIKGDNQAFDTEQISQLRNTFKAIQDQGKSVALLYPLILDDRLEIVLTTSLTTSIQRTVPIPRAELNKLITAAGQTLKDPSDTNYQALEELYEVLIAPIEAALDEAGIETLVYAPDGALRYIPLAALRNRTTGQWLIDKYQVNNITALSLTNFGQDSPQNLNVLAGAFASGSYDLKVPVSDGQTTAERSFPFSGLTHAGEEVEAIANLARTKTYLDKDFGEDVAQRFNLYNVIHLATHAQFLPETPKDSFIVFGNGEFATLRDIEATWGELNNNQLFVLSACETALGTDFSELNKTNSGIEILGLGYQLQNKGARAILASLWQVKDKSTQVLMTEFYRGLSQGNISNVEALQQAQQTLAHSPEYGHPHHWASFVLIGNGL